MQSIAWPLAEAGRASVERAAGYAPERRRRALVNLKQWEQLNE